jgi:hypothetical protein
MRKRWAGWNLENVPTRNEQAYGCPSPPKLVLFFSLPFAKEF